MRAALALAALALLCTLPVFASVDGVVMNATTQKPQASVIVTLVQPGQNGMQTLGSAKSDAEGKFTIDKEIPPGMALLQAIYQGATYNLMLPPGQPTNGVSIKIYDSTSKPGTARIAQHMVLIEPSASDLAVSETFMIENETTTTFQDPVKGSVQFYLPPGAEGKVQVTINSPGGMPIPRQAEKTSTPNVYKIAYPVKPGQSRFDVAYILPPTETLTGKIMHGDGAAMLITPSAVTLSGDGIELKGQEPQTQAHIYGLTGADYTVKISGTGSLRNPDGGAPQQDEDTGAPQLEQGQARIYTRLPWVLGLTFGILALGGWMLFRKGEA